MIKQKDIRFKYFDYSKKVVSNGRLITIPQIKDLIKGSKADKAPSTDVIIIITEELEVEGVTE